VRDFASIMDVLEVFSGETELSAFEFFADNALQKVLRHSDLPRPLAGSAPFYALLELERGDDARFERTLALFERCVHAGTVRDGVLSQSVAQARNLWRLRENISETLSRWQPYKNDISVGISRMPTFIERVETLVKREYGGSEVVWYGHIGDGNLHLNILRPETMEAEEFATRCAAASVAIAALLEELGGSISAEHGVGLLKKAYLACTRSPAELELLRGVKRVFDPLGIMNPGKVID
jgi:FAD/FMN-containing dehydrogenase